MLYLAKRGLGNGIFGCRKRPAKCPSGCPGRTVAPIPGRALNALKPDNADRLVVRWIGLDLPFGRSVILGYRARPYAARIFRPRFPKN